MRKDMKLPYTKKPSVGLEHQSIFCTCHKRLNKSINGCQILINTLHNIYLTLAWLNTYSKKIIVTQK